MPAMNAQGRHGGDQGTLILGAQEGGAAREQRHWLGWRHGSLPLAHEAPSVAHAIALRSSTGLSGRLIAPRALKARESVR